MRIEHTTRRFVFLSVLVSVLFVIDGRAADPAPTRQEAFRRIDGELSPSGTYMPRLYWSPDALGGRGGFFIVRPAALDRAHAALQPLPSPADLVDPRERVVARRILLLEHAFGATLREPRFHAALDLLRDEVLAAIAGGELFSAVEINGHIAERVAESGPIREGLTIDELQLDYTVSDIACYDDKYTREQLGPVTSCRKGGSGCMVEVPCPGGGGLVEVQFQEPYFDHLNGHGSYPLRVTGSPRGLGFDGLVVAEPTVISEARGVLHEPVNPSSPAALRAANLIDRFELLRESLSAGRLASALSTLKQETIRRGVTVQQALGDRPDLRGVLTIDETAPIWAPAAETEVSVEAGELTCYDTGYRVLQPPLRCRKGGQGCWVEIPCPMTGGLTVLQEVAFEP